MSTVLLPKSVSLNQKLRQMQLNELFKKKKYSNPKITTFKDKLIIELKKNLLKCNSKYQIYAADKILKLIQDLKTKRNKSILLQFVNKLIDADFVDIICQVMATLDIELLRLLFTMLNHFKLSPKFYEYHRLSLITENLLRSLIIICKQHKKRSVTKNGIKLLISILNRKNQKYFVQNIFKQENLLNFIKKLFADKYGREDSSSYPEVLTHSLLYYGDLFKIANHDIYVTDIVKSSAKSLLRKINSDYFNNCNKLAFVALLSTTVELFLRKFIKKTNVAVLANFCVTEVIKFVAKYSFKSKQHGIVPAVCQLLLTAYQVLDPKHTNELANYLIKEGFLEYLVWEREFFMCKNKLNTQTLINNLLVKQLTLLCESKFVRNSKWQRIFDSGIQKLSSDIKSWSLHIKRKDYFNEPQITAYVFAYFYYLSLPICFESKLKHLDKLMCLIPLKISYFNTDIEIVYVKILMFLFAVSVILNYSDNWRAIKCYTKPFNRLRKFADSPEICKQIYTEHEDLIKWIVSESAGEVPLEIKHDFITRWIGNKKTSNLVLQSAAEKEKRVASLLLLLLTHCEDSLILPLYSILKNILQSQKMLKRKQRFFKYLLWDHFIFMIDKFKNNESVASNLICYIYLAIEDMPNINKNKFCSIILLLTSSMSVKSLNDKTELHIAFLRLILQIVSQLNYPEDCAERNVLITNKNFIEFIKFGIFSDDKNIFTLSVDTIKCLDQLQSRNCQLDLRLEIKLEDLNTVMRKDIHIAFSAVKLFVMAIPRRELKPFFSITMLSTDHIYQIYFNIISICMIIPNKTEQCWKCLSYILNNHKDNFNLAISPWTAVLIEHMILMADVYLNDLNWLSFLKSWLISLQPGSGSWPTKGLFSHNVIANVIKVVSGEVIAASCVMCNLEFVILSKLILNLKINLRDEIKSTLREIMKK